MGMDTNTAPTKSDLRNSEVGRRIVAALEHVANDPNETPAKRRAAARKLAAWKA